MNDLQNIEAYAVQASSVGKPVSMSPKVVFEMVAEMKALRNVETHARTSVGKLLLNVWGHSLSTYFDELATALSDLDFLRNKNDIG